VVRQFLGGRMQGPIGMAEEKDAALVEQELAELGEGQHAPPDTSGSASASTSRLLPGPGVPLSPRWQAIAGRAGNGSWTPTAPLPPVPPSSAPSSREPGSGDTASGDTASEGTASEGAVSEDTSWFWGKDR
jgi:hypothetical protein